MPLFKFSTPVNTGHILLQVSVDGDAIAPSYGDIVLDGMVSILGQQTAANGEGALVVSALLSGQAFAPAEGDIQLSVVVSGYSGGAADKTGSANILFYPHFFVTLDGDAILNGVANGSIIIRGVEIAGREAAHGSAVLRKPIVSGFGSRRVAIGTILVESNIVTVSGVALKEVDARPSVRGSIRVRPSLVFGMAWCESVRDMYCSGSIIIGGAVLTGFCTLGLSESDDLALKYEDRRRRL